MTIVVGLGNIGSEYEKTRHNVGFMVIQRLADLKQMKLVDDPKFEGSWVKEADLILLTPNTYMNDSGRSVSKVVNYFKTELENVYVVHDDLDLRLGEYKIQQAKGPKAHNGVGSVERELGGSDFWRVRIGIDSRNEETQNMTGSDYVLSRFGNGEMRVVDEVIGRVTAELLKILDKNGDGL